MIRKFDFLIIGSGVAGMSYALKVADAGKGKVALVCKTTLEEANTAKAQGPAKSPMVFDTPSADSAKADAHWLMASSEAPAQIIITISSQNTF